MTQLLFMIGVGALMLFFQTVVLTLFPFSLLGVIPDLSMIFLVLFSISLGQMRGQIAGFCVGLLKDVLSASVLGYYALVGMILGSAAGLLRDRFFLESYPVAVIVVAVATFIKYAVSLLVAAFFTIEGVTGAIFSLTFLIELLLNAVFVFPIFSFIRFFTKRMNYAWQWERRE